MDVHNREETDQRLEEIQSDVYSDLFILLMGTVRPESWNNWPEITPLVGCRARTRTRIPALSSVLFLAEGVSEWREEEWNGEEGRREEQVCRDLVVCRLELHSLLCFQTSGPTVLLGEGSWEGYTHWKQGHILRLLKGNLEPLWGVSAFWGTLHGKSQWWLKK